MTRKTKRYAAEPAAVKPVEQNGTLVKDLMSTWQPIVGIRDRSTSSTLGVLIVATLHGVR